MSRTETFAQPILSSWLNPLNLGWPAKRQRIGLFSINSNSELCVHQWSPATPKERGDIRTALEDRKALASSSDAAVLLEEHTIDEDIMATNHSESNDDDEEERGADYFQSKFLEDLALSLPREFRLENDVHAGWAKLKYLEDLDDWLKQGDATVKLESLWSWFSKLECLPSGTVNSDLWRKTKDGRLKFAVKSRKSKRQMSREENHQEHELGRSTSACWRVEENGKLGGVNFVEGGKGNCPANLHWNMMNNKETQKGKRCRRREVKGGRGIGVRGEGTVTRDWNSRSKGALVLAGRSGKDHSLIVTVESERRSLVSPQYTASAGATALGGGLDRGSRQGSGFTPWIAVCARSG
ncbi:hypothetical protein DFJ73DRAFT_957892 [Zopfochytrium polystomum]|nr:hypothetical protein DFJ73DRAFT_957892 [Zopfochytrium polystomum]